MKHYLFYDEELEEEFLVGASTLDEAYDIARDYFCRPTYQEEIFTEWEAEASGLDEY